MRKFLIGACVIFQAIVLGVASIVFLLIIYQAGHQADVRRARAMGITCGDWFC